MKKILMIGGIVILLAFILFMFIFVNDNESSDEHKEESTKSNTNTSDKPNEPQNKSTSSSRNVSNSKEYTTAKENAEKYLDMAYNYDLNNEYKKNKSIFSKRMFKQLQSYELKSKGTKYGKNDDIERSVSDITIYFDTDKEFPEKALYTAKVKANNKKEKSNMIRTVTGEVEFTDEQGEPKIDGSQEISAQESED